MKAPRAPSAPFRGRSYWLSLLLLCASASCSDTPTIQQPIRSAPERGLSPTGAVAMEAALQRMANNTDPARCFAELMAVASMPREAGSPTAEAAALHVQQQMQLHGLQTRIEEHAVLLPEPVEARLEMLQPVAWQATVHEQALPEDPDTAVFPQSLPVLAYSPDCDVTAPLVYVNRGLPSDYSALKQQGIKVEGRIGIARYGGSYRGTKLKLAASEGLLGLVLYCDPADDGFAKGDAWPRGPWRPESSLQRGSVLDISTFSGDPLTPLAPAIPSVARVRLEDAPGIPAIGGLAITARDAAALLSRLAGPSVPAGFQGALPFAYHCGGDDSVRVHLRLRSRWSTRTIRNVIGEIRGAVDPEVRILVTAHRDAWCAGAMDNATGTVALTTMAGLLGRLARQGLKPARTITLISTDAEEYGLIGSTEFAEFHDDELTRGAALCINLDAVVSGAHFGSGGAPELRCFVETAALVVPELVDYATRAMGSGSDFAPFLQRTGLPALSVESSGPYGVYHSVCDTRAWMRQHGDPDGTRLAKVALAASAIAFSAADSTVHALDCRALVRWLRGESAPLETQLSPEELSALTLRHSHLERASERVAQSISETAACDPDPVRLTGVNRQLATLGRALLLDKTALPFRNALLGVDPQSGYGARTLPVLRDCVALPTGPQRDESFATYLAVLDRFAQSLWTIDAALRAAQP